MHLAEVLLRSSQKIDSSGGSRQTPSACKYIRTPRNSLAKIRDTGVFANERNPPSCRWLSGTGDQSKLALRMRHRVGWKTDAPRPSWRKSRVGYLVPVSWLNRQTH